MIQADPNAKAFIFDMDGTMADTMPTHFVAWTQTADKYGFKFPENLFYDWGGVPSDVILERLKKEYALDFDVKEAEEFKENAFLELATDVKPLEEVTDLVKALHGNFPIACGTGSLKETAKMILKAIGMDIYFDIVITADDIERAKPFPDMFLKCAELMGVAPKDCQVFEDGGALEAGEAAGMIVTDVKPHLYGKKAN